MGKPAKGHVVQTQANAGTKAFANLGRQGFQTCLPRYLQRHCHARRVDTVTAPIVPGYLFVSVNLAAQRLPSIHSTIGVARLLCRLPRPSQSPGWRSWRVEQPFSPERR